MISTDFIHLPGIPFNIILTKGTMQILVTGSNGQLGREIRKLSLENDLHKFTFIDFEDIDLTDAEKVEFFFQANQPDIILHCAAYTAVDKAEQDEVMARFINVNAVKYLSQISKKHNVYLIHVSTDYVFDGMNYKPYSEDDPINPISAYGKSKADGEKELLQLAGNAIIIRTSWLYSSYKNNFVKTILKLAKEKGKLDVIFDQIGTPTYAGDLAKAILEAIPQIAKVSGTEIYNFSNEGVTSWYDFAKAIVDIAGIKCTINPIETKEYKQDARRPLFSVLNKSKFKKTFKQDIPYWRDSLEVCMTKMKVNK